MTKDITILNDKAIGVDVPKEAKKFIISHAQSDNDLLWINEWGHPNYLKTLPGELMSWTILGLAKDLTEDQWKEVVVAEKGFGYPSHGTIPNGWYQWLGTAKESGYSLLKSLSLDPETTLILIKQQL